jgi:hypothetical protein
VGSPRAAEHVDRRRLPEPVLLTRDGMGHCGAGLTGA